MKMLKNKLKLIIIGIFLISLVYAQYIPPLGGGGRPIIELKCPQDFNCSIEFGEGYYCDIESGGCRSAFVDCLVKNCDAICKERNYDDGNYHEEDKCWCNSYIETKSGKTLDSLGAGWIKIKECKTSGTSENDLEKEKPKVSWYVSLMNIFLGIVLGSFITFLITYKHFKKKLNKK